MSVENQEYHVRSQELTLARRGEKLFERIEKKIRILKTIREITASLPVPQGSDSEDVVLEENKRFDRVLKQAWESFPEAKTLYTRYQTLELLTKEYSLALQLSFEGGKELPQDEKMEKLLSEMDEIFRNDDVRFLLTIEKGVRATLEKRNKIRALFQELGERYLSPEAYQETTPLLKDLGFQENDINAVRPERFSITLVLSVLPRLAVGKKDEAIAAKTRKTKRNKNPLILGWHSPNSFYNFIDADEVLIDSLFGKKTDIEEIRSHEDFHSLIEVFWESSFSYEAAVPLIRKRVQLIQRLQNMNVSRLIIDYSIGSLKVLIRSLPSMYQNEFLADLAMSEKRDNVGRRLLFLTRRTESKILADLKKSPGLKEIVETELKALNLEEFVVKVKSLYQTVSQQSPNHLPDLDIAFALFPFNKIRHIERLVARWASS